MSDVRPASPSPIDLPGNRRQVMLPDGSSPIFRPPCNRQLAGLKSKSPALSLGPEAADLRDSCGPRLTTIVEGPRPDRVAGATPEMAM